MDESNRDPLARAMETERHFARIQAVHAALAANPPRGRREVHLTLGALHLQRAIEVYCSNNQEGSQVPMDLGLRMLLRNEEPDWPSKQLQQDAKDLRGTWAALHDTALQPDTPDTVQAWNMAVRDRHRTMFGHRPELSPGEFKQVQNWAGGIKFAHPDSVVQLIRQSFELIKALPRGLPRAALEHFAAIEIHPFRDGNGRTSRMTANAETQRFGQQRCVLTWKHREESIKLANQLRKAVDNDSAEAPQLGVAIGRQWEEWQDWTLAQPWHDEAEMVKRLLEGGHILETETGPHHR